MDDQRPDQAFQPGELIQFGEFRGSPATFLHYTVEADGSTPWCVIKLPKGHTPRRGTCPVDAISKWVPLEERTPYRWARDLTDDERTHTILHTHDGDTTMVCGCSYWREDTDPAGDFEDAIRVTFCALHTPGWMVDAANEETSDAA